MNILSYKPGTKFKGKDIKDWIKFHTINSTSKSKIARRMLRFLNISDDKLYSLSKEDYSSCQSYNDYLVIREGKDVICTSRRS